MNIRRTVYAVFIKFLQVKWENAAKRKTEGEVKKINLKTMEMVAENTKKQWYLLQSEIAVVLGITRQSAGKFLRKHSVPYYGIGKSKKFFLPDVLTIVEKTRWKD